MVNPTIDTMQAQREMLLDKERRANSPLRKFARNKAAMVGLIVVLFMILISVFAPLIAPYNPTDMDLMNIYAKPGQAGHLLGTDDLGRDLLSRIIYGGRVSLLVAVGGMLLGGVIGILLGLIAGFKGGAVDTVIMRIMDGMFAFPFVLLAIILMTVLGEGIHNVILAIGIANIPGFARIIRGQVHIVKNEEYCSAVNALGASPSRLLFHHILPNCLSPMIVYATLNVAGAIISEASLSFLGLGIQPPTPSWGNILRSGKDALSTAPYVSLFSGLAIFVTVLGFNLFGDGLRDVFDPKMKK